MAEMKPQSRPSMILRSSWGAVAAQNSGSCTRTNSPQYIIVHNSGDANDALSKTFGSDERGFMKRLQEIHFGIGDCDLGYNYCIGLAGSLLEGADPTKEGRHTLGYNATSIGVCVHGNYNIRTLTSEQKNTLIYTLAWLCYKYNIHPTNIKGHGEVNSTDCPGADIKSKLSDIKTQVTYLLYPNEIPAN